MFLNLDLSNISSWLDLGYAFLLGQSQKWYCILFYCLLLYLLLICPLTGVLDLYHLIKMEYVKLASSHKINKCFVGDTLKLCDYAILHSHLHSLVLASIDVSCLIWLMYFLMDDFLIRLFPYLLCRHSVVRKSFLFSSPFPHLKKNLISVWTNGFLFYSMCYKSLLSLFSCPNLATVNPYKIASVFKKIVFVVW